MMINEKEAVIFNADAIIFWIFFESVSIFNLLTNRMTPDSIPIFPSTSEISIIEFANAYIPKYSIPTHLANRAVYR